jgi:hypothetical protein
VNEVESGIILAWQELQVSLFWLAVKERPPRMILRSLGAGRPFCAASRQTRLCSALPPWQVSQLMPGSAQVVR